jgi:hypothetical protein
MRYIEKIGRFVKICRRKPALGSLSTSTAKWAKPMN